MSLGLFLSFQLAIWEKLQAAELASAMINKSDKTIRERRALFFQNEGESTQGKYQRSGSPEKTSARQPRITFEKTLMLRANRT